MAVRASCSADPSLVRAPDANSRGLDGSIRPWKWTISRSSHAADMAPSERRVDRGSRQAAELRRRLGAELREARIKAGLSQRQVAASTGVSGSFVSRVERAQLINVSMESLARHFAVLGMRLSARPYPEGPPLRDIAHTRLLSRFRARLPSSIRLRTEVPLAFDRDLRAFDRDLRAFDRDLRAWDGELVTDAGTCKLEAETALYDLQATDRRISLKMADDHVDVVVLLVADTQRNRSVLREFGALLENRYPIGTRGILGALQAGRLPERSGIVIL